MWNYARRVDAPGSDPLRAGPRAQRLALAAIVIDVLLLIAARSAVEESVGPAIREHVSILSGQCLTWSLWAPLIVSLASSAAIVLAYRAPWWEAPSGSRTRLIVSTARIVSVVVTIAWAATALVVAYANVSTCVIDWPKA
jgi:hypothetical protein